MTVEQIKSRASKMCEAIRKEVAGLKNHNLEVEYLNDIADFVDAEIMRAWGNYDDIDFEDEEIYGKIEVE